jgi:hypothetical protein
MPLEGLDRQYWQAAVGYVELSMFEQANEELEKIDAFNRAAPEALALRIEIYRGLKKCELMGEIAKRLNEFQPNEVQWAQRVRESNPGVLFRRSRTGIF